ncbi:hypothetical protein DPX16_5492 [Anabarilius grahami]|uniref:PARP catalytic domain-containing protein n=1 Tax=Anabarilius grahami TaxID=495550 RepID=A0A3N0Z9T8_ANAGA|nr:hypothetical protein DPX16_5492 [Anabarilius grahami]
MYHGTTMFNAMRIMSEGFSPSADGMLGPGVYVTRSFEKASRYPLNSNGEMLAVLRLRVRVGKVKKIKYQGHPLQKTWSEHGYDTASLLTVNAMADNGYDIGIQRYPGQRTYIMYHGTTMANAQKIQREGFRPSSDGMLGYGVYVSRSREKASRYPINAGGQELAILKLSVRVGKVKRIDRQDHPLQKTWNQHGYDTAWVPANCGMVNSGLEEDCVYDPSRIKVLEILPNFRN